MKRYLFFLILVFFLFNFKIGLAQIQTCNFYNQCDDELVKPCMFYGGWCCTLGVVSGSDCEGTSIILEALPDDICKTCLENPDIPESINSYIGLNGKLDLLNITLNATYDKIQYSTIRVNCTLNNNKDCGIITSPGLINCLIPTPSYNFTGVDELNCKISHPTLYLINTSSTRKFRVIDFDILPPNQNFTTGKSILSIDLKSKSLLTTNFTMNLETLTPTYVKIYEPVKKTNDIGCGEEEKVSYELDISTSRDIILNILTKQNLLELSCSSDDDCNFYENGKCIESECWNAYKFTGKNVEPKFDIYQTFLLVLAAASLVLIVMVIEAILNR